MITGVHIGTATVYHGDCRVLLPAFGKIGAIVSDPPYGVGYVHSGGGQGLHSKVVRSNGREMLRGTARNANRPIAGDDKPFLPAHLLALNVPTLIWGANHYAQDLPRESGGGWICWDKSPEAKGPADHFSDAEFGWCNFPVKRNVIRVLWKGIACDKRHEENGRRYHPTTKPQGLMLQCLQLLGFDVEELDRRLGPGGGGRDPDNSPPPPAVAVSKPGDIWVLGDHRVICGDSSETGVLSALMAGKLADCTWTDPPYNVAYRAGDNPILNDNMGDAAFNNFLCMAYRRMWDVMSAGAPIYVAHAETERFNFTGAFLAAGFKLSGVVIWRKNSLVMGRSDYQWIHEPILYGWKPGAAHRWFGGRSKVTVVELGDGSPFQRRPDGRWEIRLGDEVLIVSGDAEVELGDGSVLEVPKPSRSELHPTMKPVVLIERMLRNSAKPGAIILDPFGGSGSTLVAAERLKMKARLAELDPVYVDVIVQRWQDFTQKVATHQESGVPFPRQPVA